MKNTLSFNAPPWIVTVFSFVLTLGLCAAFFAFLPNLPETVPVHYSNGVGVDRWGERSELIGMPVMALVISAAAFVISAVCIKKQLSGFAYFASGLSLFVTLVLSLVAAMFIRIALQG